MNFMKKGFVFVLSFVLVFGTALPVEASGHPTDEVSEAGQHLADVMDLILHRYVGDPVTLNILMEAALRGMTDVLDQYSVYLSAAELDQFTQSLTGRLVGIGVSMLVRYDGRIEVARVLPSAPAEAAGVLAGDIIVYVDGVNVDGYPTDIVAALITNPDTDRVLIGFERDGRIITFDILKAEIRSPTVVVDRLEQIPEAYGFDNLYHFRYMQISSVSLTTGDDVRRAISQMQAENVAGIIIDLRGNTGGSLEITIDIANQLVPAGTVLQTVNQSGRRRTYSSVLPEAPFDNIVVLVNRFTASAAEVIASALQDADAAVIVGEQTFGKGLVQSVYSLETGGALMLTTEEYFRRSGHPINDIGIMPCILAQRTQNSERDDVLRTGLEILIGGL